MSLFMFNSVIMPFQVQYTSKEMIVDIIRERQFAWTQALNQW